MNPEKAAQQMVDDTVEEFDVTASRYLQEAWIDLTDEDSESRRGLERNLYGYADTTAGVHDLEFSYDRRAGHEATGDTNGLVVVVTFWEADDGPDD